MNNPRDILPKGFFEIPRKTITSTEAMKDVIPVDWENIIVKKEEKVDKNNKDSKSTNKSKNKNL